MTSIAIPVDDPSQVAEARRACAWAASAAAIGDAKAGKLAVVATEAGTNLLKHGGGGEILVRRLESGVELLSLDKGRGMRDIAACLSDGHSTAGTAGNGLGAIERLSDEFDIYSEESKGTAILVRVFAGQRAQSARPPGPESLNVGAVSIALPGETACGDSWSVYQEGSHCTVMVVDGLGHGPDAAKAASEAAAVFAENAAMKPAEIIDAMHAALRHTRGGAAAVARIDRQKREVRFSGIGNVAGVVAAPGLHKQMVSHPGIIGHNAGTIREFQYEWPRGAVVILHSDGLTGHWNLDAYAGLAAHDAGIMAGVLYRDHRRTRDDATVVAIREYER